MTKQGNWNSVDCLNPYPHTHPQSFFKTQKYLVSVVGGNAEHHSLSLAW